MLPGVAERQACSVHVGFIHKAMTRGASIATPGPILLRCLKQSATVFSGHRIGAGAPSP
jgi:hypothetical protein